MKVREISDLLIRVLILVFILFNIGCDQVTKNMVRERVDYHANIKVINDHITLTKVENTGAFLSAGDTLSAPLKFVLLTLLPLLTLLFGLYMVMRKQNMPAILVVGICFVIGGGVGNLYDRIIYGSVTDFLHIDFVIFQTGVFNVADMSIMAGMALIIINSFYKKEILTPTEA
ncbi:signal peptidase II [Pedobacter sp. MC2016-24]|uniref:signal peptidase II n=1 Tax=Pedobacter sp. MC2016-24 TaxID=2780090 RepID=UPI001881F008|nr:signal peptidase II [Pedobacter sp. MC2016-24]MBE9598304.1 signal peptidase II [Pedobacter sp. MC2016-24]